MGACADRRNNTKIERDIEKKNRRKKVSCVICHILCVRYQVSHVTYHVWHVTCHLSLTPTSTAIDPPPINYPTMHGKLVPKHLKTNKKSKSKNLLKLKKNQQFLEVCQYQRYPLRPEVFTSNCLGIIKNSARWARKTEIVTSSSPWYKSVKIFFTGRH